MLGGFVIVAVLIGLLRRVVGFQSVGEVLQVSRQTKAAWLGVWLCTPRLPQVWRHRASSSVWPQVVPHGTGQAPFVSGIDR